MLLIITIQKHDNIGEVMFKLNSKKDRNKMMRNERIAFGVFGIFGLLTFTLHMIWGLSHYTPLQIYLYVDYFVPVGIMILIFLVLMY